MNVSSKYQITIPQNVRDVMKINKNDMVYFSTNGKDIFLKSSRLVPRKNITTNHINTSSLTCRYTCIYHGRIIFR
ncbi:AbrB/MazE/SpoVT family DNA-binding domain-containing protein [Lysinibacillus capsici]|uniref:AbrB/MazE/SpoVT family DNA-binding domain-containing protein n=1 Tax=Lysinibacillus capsici TaxID=2115968 RepID=UPI003989A346